MTRLRIIIGMLLLSLVGLAGAAQAVSSVTVIIPLETVVHGDPGEVLPVRDPIPVSELDAEPGWFCNVTVIAGNGESEHEGTDLIIGSNGDEVVALNVETSAGKVTSTTGTLTLGETVTFDGRIGEDGVLSAGMSVVFECFEERPPPSTSTTTTTQPTTTTTSTSTTIPPDTTTTTVPPTTNTTTSTTTSTTLPEPTTTTAPPDLSTTTTEVPPPTLIESGDAGYIDEVEEGEEHEDENPWLMVVILITGIIGLLVVVGVTIYAIAKNNEANQL